MAMPSLLSSLTNYPKWRCQIGGEMFAMMNVPSNQPIKKNPPLSLINGVEKRHFAKEIGPFVSLFLLFFSKKGEEEESPVLPRYRLYLLAWLTFSHFLPWPVLRFGCNMACCFCLKTIQVTLLSARLIESKTVCVSNESESVQVVFFSPQK